MPSSSSCSSRTRVRSSERPEQSSIDVTLKAPNTTIAFGALRMDVVKQLTGKSMEDWLEPVLTGSRVMSDDCARREYTLRFDEGEGFEIPGLLAAHNRQGQLVLAIPLRYAASFGRHFGVEGQIVGSLAEYTLPTDGSRIVSFDTQLGAVTISAERASVQGRNT